MRGEFNDVVDARVLPHTLRDPEPCGGASTGTERLEHGIPAEQQLALDGERRLLTSPLLSRPPGRNPASVDRDRVSLPGAAAALHGDGCRNASLALAFIAAGPRLTGLSLAVLSIAHASALFQVVPEALSSRAMPRSASPSRTRSAAAHCRCSRN